MPSGVRLRAAGHRTVLCLTTDGLSLEVAEARKQLLPTQGLGRSVGSDRRVLAGQY